MEIVKRRGEIQMKNCTTILLVLLSLTLGPQTGAVAQSGSRQSAGYSYGDQWHSSDFADRLGSPPQLHTIFAMGKCQVLFLWSIPAKTNVTTMAWR